MITLYQTGNEIKGGGDVYPHSCNYPAMFTCKSTYFDLKYDLKYVFRIYDSNGLIFEQYNSPDKNGLGVFNSSLIIKNFLSYSIQETKILTNIDYLKEYRVTVQEYYDEALQGSEVNYDKSIGGNLSYNEFNSILPYKITNNRFGNFLTNQDPTKRFKQTKNTRASWILPNDSSFKTWNRIIISTYLRLNDGDYVTWVYEISSQTTYDFDKTDATINSAENGTIKIPIGYKTLTESAVTRLGFYDANDVWHTDTFAQIGVNTHLGQAYIMIRQDIQLYDVGTEVSPKYSWYFNESFTDIQCYNKTITIIWKNKYGGTDFFNFNKVRNDKIESNKSFYSHSTILEENNKYFDDLSSNNYGVIDNEINYLIKVRSNFVSKHEIDLLKSLWDSDEIGMYIEDDYYPIISLTDTVEIPSKETIGFILYEFDIKYAKIIR